MKTALLATAISAVLPVSAAAQALPDSPIQHGAYAALMAAYVDDDQLGAGYGGTIALGYRRPYYAIEAVGLTTSLDAGDLLGGSVNGLLFPLQSLPQLYATIGLGAADASSTEHGDYPLTHFDAGLGYIWSVSWGRYDFGVRTETRYRYGKREEKQTVDRLDIDAPRSFAGTVVQLGLHLPFGRRPPTAAQEQRPVEVVPTLTP